MNELAFVLRHFHRVEGYLTSIFGELEMLNSTITCDLIWLSLSRNDTWSNTIPPALILFLLVLPTEVVIKDDVYETNKTLFSTVQASHPVVKEGGAQLIISTLLVLSFAA